MCYKWVSLLLKFPDILATTKNISRSSHIKLLYGIREHFIALEGQNVELLVHLKIFKEGICFWLWNPVANTETFGVIVTESPQNL